MILSFNKKNCIERDFPAKILDGTKKHTLRADPKERWKVGMKVEFYAMNPRNKGKLFARGKITEIVPVTLQFKPVPAVVFEQDETNKYKRLHCTLYPCNTIVWARELDNFAVNDGFEDWFELYKFFEPEFKDKLHLSHISVEYRLLVWELTEKIGYEPIAEKHQVSP